MQSTQQPEKKKGRSRFVVPLLAGICGTILVAFGWLIPSQFKSLPASVLVEAGRDTPGLNAFVDERIDEARPGVAEVFAKTLKVVGLPSEAALAKVAAYKVENPDLAIWGEPNAYLTGAFSAEAVRGFDPEAGVIRHFLPAASRRAVGSYLEGSRNAATRAILETRELSSYSQFLPVFSAGGAPLEATINLTAMLIQSDALDPKAVRELRTLAEEANRSGEVAGLEMVYLDLLALGRRCNWGQLTGLTRNVQSLETLAKIRHLMQINPESTSVLSSAIYMSGRPDEIVEHVFQFGPESIDALAFALYHGSGSLDLLLRQHLPVDGDLSLPPSVKEEDLTQVAIDPLVRLALHQPVFAVAAKIAAYLLGGLLFFIVAERGTALHRLELSPMFTNAARAVGALVVCLLLVIINEPYLALGSEPSGFQLRVVVPILGATSPEIMPDSSNAFPVDVATMVSITFFFMLQALVYLICLLKLREIAARQAPPLLKLRLAENEENLFDSGLYVGIAGTSAALVLQVIGVIEANLLAAYSSNLFGILCVAFVKIRHVRPFKHKLILELSEMSGDSGEVNGPAKAK